MSKDYKHSWEKPNDMDNTTTSTHSIALDMFYERKANHKQLKLEKYSRLDKDKLERVMKHFEEAYVPIEQALKRKQELEIENAELKAKLNKLFPIHTYGEKDV